MDTLFATVPTGSQESTDQEAADAYGKISPAVAPAIGAAFSQASPIEALSKAAQRGQYAGSSFFDRAVHAVTNLSNAAGDGYFPTDLPKAPIDTPRITPEQTKQYSPDGKALSTTPIPEELAKVLGEQKRDELKQQDILSRFENAHSWPSNFGVGLAGQLLDPLNTASMFVPGLGEERILAQAGAETGLLGRTGLRLAAGATQGVTGQLPLIGLKYGLSQETTQDYGIRDAMSDLFYSAVGGAAGYATIGLAHEAGFGTDRVLKNVLDAKNWKEYTNAMAGMNEQLAKGYNALANQPAPVMHYTMSTSIAQLMDGRPVDITPVLNTRLSEQLQKLNDQIESTQNSIAEIYQNAGLTPQFNVTKNPETPEIPQRVNDLKTRLSQLDEGQEQLSNHPQLQAKAEAAIAGRDTSWITKARSEVSRIAEDPEASPEDINKADLYRDQIAKHEADQHEIQNTNLSEDDLRVLRETKSEIRRIQEDPDASAEDQQRAEGLRAWAERVETKRLAGKLKATQELNDQVSAHGETVSKARAHKGYTDEELQAHLPDEDYQQLQALHNVSNQLIEQFEKLRDLSSSLQKWDTVDPIPYHQILEAHSHVSEIFDSVGGDWYKLSAEQREEIEGWERFIQQGQERIRELKGIDPADLPKLQRYPDLPGLPAGKKIEPMLYNSTDFGKIPKGPRQNSDIFDPKVNKFYDYRKPTTLGELQEIIKTKMTQHDYLFDPTPADVVKQQKELRQSGFASGVNQNDLQAEVKALADTKPQPPKDPILEAKKAAFHQEAAELKDSHLKYVQVLKDELTALQEAEHNYGMANPSNPTLEAQEQLDITAKGITDADAKSQAYTQASDCIAESGI